MVGFIEITELESESEYLLSQYKFTRKEKKKKEEEEEEEEERRRRRRREEEERRRRRRRRRRRKEEEEGGGGRQKSGRNTETRVNINKTKAPNPVSLNTGADSDQ